MSIFKPIVGLYSSLKPRQAITKLHVEGLAVRREIGQDGAMVDIGKFRQKFRRLFRPYDVRSANPLPEIPPRQSDFVSVHRSAQLQTI